MSVLDKTAVSFAVAGAAVGGAGMFVGAVAVVPILSAFFGAFAGYVVGWAFDETTVRVLSALNVNLELWEVGAALAFFGSFFKTSLTSKG